MSANAPDKVRDTGSDVSARRASDNPSFQGKGRATDEGTLWTYSTLATRARTAGRQQRRALRFLPLHRVYAKERRDLNGFVVRKAKSYRSDVWAYLTNWGNLRDLQHDTEHRVLVVTRKGGKRAKIVLPPAVVAALSAYLGASSAEGIELANADAASEDAPIVTTASGKRWASSEAFRTVQRLARAAGIEGKISPHGLRHTHATLALDAGVPLRDLQDSMGHADPRTTRRDDRARARLERSSAYAVAGVLA